MGKWFPWISQETWDEQTCHYMRWYECRPWRNRYKRTLRPIDIMGFTDEERNKFSVLLNNGFIDTFRRLYPRTNNLFMVVVPFPCTGEKRWLATGLFSCFRQTKTKYRRFKDTYWNNRVRSLSCWIGFNGYIKSTYFSVYYGICIPILASNGSVHWNYSCYNLYGQRVTTQIDFQNQYLIQSHWNHFGIQEIGTQTDINGKIWHDKLCGKIFPMPFVWTSMDYRHGSDHYHRNRL